MTTLHEPIDVVLNALKAAGCDPKERSGKITAKCPAHDDGNPSLGVKAASDGTVLVKCRSHGCTFPQIAAALKLKETDFFRRPLNGEARGHPPKPKPETFKDDSAFLDHLAQYTFVFPAGEDANRAAKCNLAAIVYGAANGRFVRGNDRKMIIVSLPGFEEAAQDVATSCLAFGAKEVFLWTLTDDEWKKFSLKLVRFEEPWTENSASVKQVNPGFVGFVGSPPQVRPISVDLRPVPPLDEVLIPGPFKTWLKDIAERACCPLDIPAMAALVSFAAVAGRKIAIRPKRQDDWTVVPNLWGMAVLPPGWLKTHCLEEPKKPLARLEIEAREVYAQALQDFAVTEAVAAAQIDAAKSELKDRAKKKNGKAAATEDELRTLAAQALAKPALVAPTLRRYIVNDATVEKLGELLAENPNGLLLYRDELMGFLKALEKQGHEGDRAFYLESWNGTGSYSYDRIGRGSLFIPSNTVSVLGGIQPGKLAAYIRSAGSGENDDGLIPRFQLAIYPDVDQPFVNVDRWPDTAAKNTAYAVFEKLVSLNPMAIGATIDPGEEIPYLRFDDDAQIFFDGWRVELEAKVRSSREAANLTSHLSKYRSLMPSLALLFHLIEVASGLASGPVSLLSARRAAAWCDYLEQHARRIYQAAFDGDPEPAQRLAERLTGNLPNPFSVRDVVQKGWKSLGTTEEAERAVAALEEHGWVVREDIPTTQAGGRPSVKYHINPLVLNGGIS